MNKIKLPGLTHFGKFDWLPISTICSTTNPIFWHQLFPSIQWDLKSWKFCTLWSWMTFLPKKMNIDCDQDHKGYCMLIYYNIKHFEEDVKYYVHMLLWQIRIVQFNLFGLYIASHMSATTDTGINMQVTNHLHIIHGMKNDANFLKIKMCIKIRNYVTLQKRCYKIEWSILGAI